MGRGGNKDKAWADLDIISGGGAQKTRVKTQGVLKNRLGVGGAHFLWYTSY